MHDTNNDVNRTMETISLNHKNIIKEMTSINWDFLDKYNNDPDEMYTLIKSKISKIYDDNTIKKKIIKGASKAKKPWITEELLALINKKKQFVEII